VVNYDLLLSDHTTHGLDFFTVCIHGSVGTSREKLIAGRLIAGESECNSPVVILPLMHSIIFAGDNCLSPVHSIHIRQRYGLGGPPAQVRHIRIFIPGAYNTYAPGIEDLPPANICSVHRG
jgi:hypothetical protein